jgi:hypothetical protein
MAAAETAGPSTALRSGRDDNSVVAGIDATEQCPTPATELSSRSNDLADAKLREE